jgi:iron complex outermembrane receptor protein
VFTDNRAPGVGTCCTQRIDPSLTLYQGAYAITDARVTLKLDKLNAEAAVYVRNLTDKSYIASVTDLAALGYRVVSFGDPRTYGVEVKKRF